MGANYASKVINVAYNEIGYLEKNSSSSLDSKTANAGNKNYTKYSRDLIKIVGAPYAQGVAWCDNFVDWCFIQAFGKNTAKKLLNGWSAYTPTSAQYYKNIGRYFKTNPMVGDQIFFHNNTTICHTGIVYKVDNTYVYTIEGNTSGASGVIANGGGVCQKKYRKDYSRIDGYGRPAYDFEKGVSTKPTSSAAKATTKGYSGDFPFVPPTIRKGSRGAEVVKLQKFLNWFGSYALVLDGIAGDYTVKAIKDFQKRTGLTVDGQFGTRSLAMAKVMKK